MACFAYAYADYKGVSVNLFATREERDAAVRDLLSQGYEADQPDVMGAVPFSDTATAEEAWQAFCNTDTPDFHLGFAEM